MKKLDQLGKNVSSSWIIVEILSYSLSAHAAWGRAVSQKNACNHLQVEELDILLWEYARKKVRNFTKNETFIKKSKTSFNNDQPR